MRSLIGTLVPFLLSTTSRTKSPALSDLSQNLRQLYCDLERPGPLYEDITPTMRLSYVTPPTPNGTSTWRSSTAESMAELNLQPDPSKPLALYLPGLDGYGVSACQDQFDQLASTFELWRLTVFPDDRTLFPDMVDAISLFVTEKKKSTHRKVLLIGESFGGVLASAVALRLRSTEVLQGLVLVNPATSFDQTSWDSLVPLLTLLDQREQNSSSYNDPARLSPYNVVGSLVLTALVPDRNQLSRVINTIRESSTFQRLPNLDAFRESIDVMTDSFRVTGERLPAALLEHRVQQWLMPAVPVVNARLNQIAVPTLVVAGTEDRLMPSLGEAERISRIIPNCEKVIIPNRGHFVLDNTVNLTEAILYSKIDPLKWNAMKKRYDPITDWKLPSREQISKDIEKRVKPLRDAHSPIYISTDEEGKRWMGLSKIPRPDGPLLFVGNHQFFAADLGLVFAELVEKRGVAPRGLAHPVSFTGQPINDLYGRIPGVLDDSPNAFTSNFQQYGAVMVNPRNYYRLLQSGQDALLFPGGSREALRVRPEYPLCWPEKVDFVRTAARFNATIVPLSAIGMADSVTILADIEDVFNAPILGELARNVSQSVTAARYDESKEDEIMGFPVFAPRAPARNYFLFGKPISTVNVDPNDKEACKRLYRETQAAVRVGLDDLLRARKNDPFGNAIQRLAYERVFNKQAPTFPIDSLNT